MTKGGTLQTILGSFYNHLAMGIHIRLLALAIFTGLLISPANAQFIQSFGDTLTLNGAPFRCAGTNIYWLGLDENVGSISYPTEFRIDDALDTAKEMGAILVRAHTLGVSTGNKLSLEPMLNVFNDDAFKTIDYAIAAASKRGIHLLIPLTDEYHYFHGGKHNFTDWEKVNEDQFYTNAAVIADFEAYISHLLNHVSAITGIALKDDPAIMAWETGNEIHPPTSWTRTISAYIKSVDRNHLVLDGRYGVDPGALSIPTVDLVGTHFYIASYRMMAEALRKEVALTAGKKAFIVGEFAWNARDNDGDLNSFLAEARKNKGVAGVAYWSLFGHNDQHGYVQHNDGNTLHYPGDTPDMKTEAKQLREFACAMSGRSVPDAGTPPAPLITSVASDGHISWRGAAISATYQLERSTTGDNGPWTVVTTGSKTDNDTPWRDPDFPGGTVWYRIKGANLSGVFGPYSPVYRSGN